MKVKLHYIPHEKQKLIHAACSNPDIKFITVVAGRQSGKSRAAQMQIIRWALKKKCKIMVLSPTFGQAKKFYNDIAKPLINSGLITKHLSSIGGLTLEFINGSEVLFKSGASKDSLRGDTINYLVIDEAAFISKEVIDTIIPALITKKNAKILIVTTPKGKNWVFEYFNKSGEMYTSIRFTSKDNPMADVRLIDEYRKSMTPEMFNQEFEAKFVDGAAVFQHIEDICILKTNPNYKGKVWLGIDIGMLNDYTVITAINSSNEMVWYDRFTNLEAPELKKRIVKAFNQFDVVKGYIEKNNQGLPIYQDLKPILSNKIIAFDTTSKSKPEIINNLITLFSKQEIKIINDDEIKKELESFIFKFSKTGKIQFEAAGGAHDDIVMSLAICMECKNNHTFVGVPMAGRKKFRRN